MTLDLAQILKGSGFLWEGSSAGLSCAGRPGSGWDGAGGAELSLSGAASEECSGESCV